MKLHVTDLRSGRTVFFDPSPGDAIFVCTAILGDAWWQTAVRHNPRAIDQCAVFMRMTPSVGVDLSDIPGVGITNVDDLIIALVPQGDEYISATGQAYVIVGQSAANMAGGVQ